MIEIDGAPYRIGLALSGGGFRAAIFHMGVMRRLHELGILEKIDVITTVSGGAIVGAYSTVSTARVERHRHRRERVYEGLAGQHSALVA